MDVPITVPYFMDVHTPYIEASSIGMELTNQASHVHPIFREYNEAVYHCLEASTQGTSNVALLNPYQWTKYGKGDFQSIIKEHASEDKRELDIKKDKGLLHNCSWKI